MYLSKSLALAGLLAAISPISSAQAFDHISDAVAAAERPAEETQWDSRRHPDAILHFLGVEPGMIIWDQGSGRGYYTAILSRAVGPKGHIVANNSSRFWPSIKDTVMPRHQKLGNVEGVVGNITDYDGYEGEFDIVFIGLLYHHMHYTAASGEGTPDSSKAYYAKAMKMLKPGGVLAIIEHEAPKGTPRAESAAWHRATMDNAIADLTGAGFEYVGSSDVLANPDDPQTVPFRDLESGRYTSQRFVVKFRKPA